MAGALGRPGTEMKYLFRIRQFSGMGTFHRRKIVKFVAMSAPTVATDCGTCGKNRSESRGGCQYCV